MEDAIYTLGFNSEVLIVSSRDAGHAPTEVNNIILSYPSTTKIMVDSHCEILWADNSVVNLGRHPTANYAAGLDAAKKQAITAHHRLRSNIPCLWIKNPLTTNAKHMLRDFKSEYTSDAQNNGSAMFFVIVKMVQPETCAGCSYIKYNLEKHRDVPFQT